MNRLRQNKKTALYLLSLFLLVFSVTGCAPEQSGADIRADYPSQEASSADTVTQFEESAEKGVLRVSYIDVGQGDAEFVELPNGKTMLIDAGVPGSAGTVSSLISSLGYTKIDYVIATHPHNDHIGGMPSILNKYTVGTFYMPDKEHTTDIFMSMLTALRNNGCAAEYAKSGKVFIDEAGIKAVFVAPVSSGYTDLNNYSAVVRLTYNDCSFLFTGDAEDVAENEMLSSGADLKADVLKVGHHGSTSSSTAAFLSAVGPRYAVISVGDNSYGHPAEETLRRLEAEGISVYRTDLCGTVTIESDGKNYTVDKNSSVLPAEAAPSDENADAVVYKTKSGSCYHREGCTYLKSKIETTVKEGKAEGLRPCSKCSPPQ